MKSLENKIEILSLEDKEKIISNDPHILEIKNDERYPAPSISYDQLSLEARSFQENIKKLVTFINKRYYTDDFGEADEAREEWMHGKDKEYPWFSEVVSRNNCYPLKNIIVASWALGALEDGYSGAFAEEHKHIIDQIRVLIRMIFDIPVRTYGGVPSETKIQMIRGIKSDIKRLLEFYAKESDVKNKHE